MFLSKKAVEQESQNIQEVFGSLVENIQTLSEHQVGLQRILLINLIVTGVTCAVAVFTISKLKGD